jgi:hypothetical protein
MYIALQAKQQVPFPNYGTPPPGGRRNEIERPVNPSRPCLSRSHAPPPTKFPAVLLPFHERIVEVRITNYTAEDYSFADVLTEYHLPDTQSMLETSVIVTTSILNVLI